MFSIVHDAFPRRRATECRYRIPLVLICFVVAVASRPLAGRLPPVAPGGITLPPSQGVLAGRSALKVKKLGKTRARDELTFEFSETFWRARRVSDGSTVLEGGYDAEANHGRNIVLSVASGSLAQFEESVAASATLLADEKADEPAVDPAEIENRRHDRDAAAAVVAQRQAELENAEVDYERTESLFEAGLVTVKELVTAEARLESARSALEVAERNLAAAEAALAAAEAAGDQPVVYTAVVDSYRLRASFSKKGDKVKVKGKFSVAATPDPGGASRPGIYKFSYKGTVKREVDVLIFAGDDNAEAKIVANELHRAGHRPSLVFSYFDGAVPNIEPDETDVILILHGTPDPERRAHVQQTLHDLVALVVESGGGLVLTEYAAVAAELDQDDGAAYSLSPATPAREISESSSTAWRAIGRRKEPLLSGLPRGWQEDAPHTLTESTADAKVVIEADDGVPLVSYRRAPGTVVHINHAFHGAGEISENMHRVLLNAVEFAARRER